MKLERRLVSMDDRVYSSFDSELSTIIKKTRVNYLFGAGASYLPQANKTGYPLMRDLVNEIKSSNEHITKLNEFRNDSLVFRCYKRFIIEQGNFEEYLSSLEGLINYPLNDNILEKIEDIIKIVKKIVVQRIRISDDESILGLYEKFYSNLIMLNRDKEEVFKRINLFTTNYDMLTELALENMGIHFYSGFFGVKKRKFNPAFYNFTYSDDMNLKTKNYIIKNDHINLYKLHGSLSWKILEDDLIEIQDYEKNTDPVIIYPSHTKYNQTNLVAYYSTLMREFLNQLSNEQSSLIVIGYSFGDDHLNKLIESALSIENFTLVAFLYSETDYEQFMKKIGKKANTRLYYGDFANLDSFTAFIGVEND